MMFSMQTQIIKTLECLEMKTQEKRKETGQKKYEI